MLFAMVLWPLFVACFAFWIWMLIDCATQEPDTGNDKLVWIIIVVFTQVVGAAIYYFVRRRPRLLAEWQSTSAVPQRGH